MFNSILSSILSNSTGLKSCVFWYSELAPWKNNLALYTRMVEENPAHGRSHFNLAQALSRADRREEAIEEYIMAVRYDPYHASTRYNLGMFLLDIGRTDEALQHLRVYLKLRPQAPEGNFIRSLDRRR